jgi:molybdenum transport protein
MPHDRRGTLTSHANHAQTPERSDKNCRKYDAAVSNPTREDPVLRVLKQPAMPALPGAFRSDLEALLADDVPHGDLTTAALGIGDLAGVMTFTARGPMVLAEAESAAVLLEIAGCGVSLEARSGDRLPAGATILIATGSAAALHRGWKTAQTLIESWSGVATAARAIVDAAHGVSPNVTVACTRKNTPGTKSFAARAVRAGGATVHRLSLSETVLVFPEHLAFMSGTSLADVAIRLRRATPERKLVIEVDKVSDALAAAAAGFDVIQTERFSTVMVLEVAAQLSVLTPRPLIAAAGGITWENAAAYVRAGADIIVTSSPYLAKPCDVEVGIRPR